MNFSASRRFMILFAIIFVLLVAFVMTGCSQLSSKQSTVNKKYSAMLPDLTLRYVKLGEAVKIAEQVGGKRDVLEDAKKSLKDFENAKKDKNEKKQLEASRELETIIGRLRANVKSSPKLSSSPEMNAAMITLDGSMPGTDVVNEYEKAVNAYEQARTSWRLLLSALIGGYSTPEKLEFSENKS